MTRISWLNVALGLWLIVAGLILPHTSGASVTESIVAGSIVALASLWAARAFRPTVSLVASWTVTLTGIWICCAPFVLGYERATLLGVLNQILVGVAIALLAATNMRRKAALVDNR